VKYLWMGRTGVVCGYSMLKGGSPHLCRLRIVHSGSLSEDLICTNRMLALWDPVNRRSSMIIVVDDTSPFL
jgi:hypothetical protein